MKEIHPEPNWIIALPIITFFYGMAALLFVSVGTATYQVIDALWLGRGLPRDVSYWYIALEKVLMLAVGSYAVWWPIETLGLILTEEGIKKPRFPRGYRFLHWSEVYGISIKPPNIELKTSNDRMTINLLLFKAPSKIIAEIKGRIPRGDLVP